MHTILKLISYWRKEKHAKALKGKLVKFSIIKIKYSNEVDGYPLFLSSTRLADRLREE